jgi:fumarate hydratase, class II
VVADNLFAAMAGHEPLVGLHGALRTLAVALNKIANDIRLMGSGPRAGLGELRLPANEPGSSIMPGKVNPTQVEALTMVCAQVIGHDVGIGIAASQGQFELNVFKPLIATTCSTAWPVGRCDGELRDPLRRRAGGRHRPRAGLLNRSLMLVTALAPHIGYDRAALIARHAQASGLSLREAALAVGGISGAEFDAWVDPARMLGLTEPRRRSGGVPPPPRSSRAWGPRVQAPQGRLCAQPEHPRAPCGSPGFRGACALPGTAPSPSHWRL